VPIVAAPSGGIVEIVQDGVNGYLVPYTDHDRLAERLIALLQEPALGRRLGEAGRRRVQENFSLSSMVDGNLAVYRKLLRARA
jgi:glycosyltransferase involved in cell wall biosynthesis